MKLEEVSKIICEDEISLEEFLRIVSDVLRKGGLEAPVVIDKESGRVIENNKLCVALKRIGVKLMPVSHGVSEKAFVSLEDMGFFEDISPSRYRVFANTEELLYRNWPTPLVKLSSLSGNGVSIWAKLEGFNPWSMSVKDRIGWSMSRKALEKLGKDRIALLVESTSTNTGLAIAAMASIYSSKLKAFIPSTVSKTGELLLKIFGVEVIRSQKPLTIELINDVEEIAKKEGAVHLNQFYNDANFEVHLRYTAKELELQLREAGLEPKAIFGGLGTSGHMSAISIYFKNRFKGVKIYGVVPAPGTAIQGIRRVESGMKWVHYIEIDDVVEATPEEAVKGVLEVVRNEGIFIGLSSGAVYSAFKKMMKEGKLSEGDYVLIFPDMGFKYVEQISEYIEKEKS
jgi:cysteine synthase/O-phosphoserine sulfhydrylase/cystathionine beta-synthase